MDPSKAGEANRDVIQPNSAAERYRLLSDRNPQPMWVCDLETRALLAVNDAAIEHYGYSRSEFLQLTAEDLTAPDGSRSAEPGSESTPQWHRKKDGEVIEVELLADQLP